MTRVKLGDRAEAAGAAYLESLGFRILERRFRSRAGEIDLIAEEGTTLIFIEVKGRSSDLCGAPSDAVGFRKQIRIARTAAFYLTAGRHADRPCRFDVLEVMTGAGDRLRFRLIRDAFEAPSP